MSFTESFAASSAAVIGLGNDVAALVALPDAELLGAHSIVLKHQRYIEMYAAWFAAEIARRSPKDGGYSGLAQRKGFGSPEKFLQSLSPITRVEAVQLVESGTLMNSTETQSPTSLWQAALGVALRDGVLRVAAVDAIRRGLSPVADSAPASDLLAQCQRLIARSAFINLDELALEARAARDRLDEAGIERREKHRRDNRYLKRWVRGDGMYQGGFLLDPENGLQVFAALDAIASPRRMPQFVEGGAPEASAISDTRTTDQRLADGFVDMVRLAVDSDSGSLFGAHRPAVRVLVTAESLAKPTGHGYFEGDPQPVSHNTVDRYVCDTGIIGIKFDRTGQILDLGRTQRLFSANQRIMLSVRDGGCIFPNCGKAPSQCEAHHIHPWDRDHGLTNLNDGVLLCRHHHMLLHNNHWQIIRADARYWLKPPRTEDPEQRLRPLNSNNPLLHRSLPDPL